PSLILQGPSKSGEASGRDDIDNADSLNRREEFVDPSFHVIACVDVKSNAQAYGKYETSDILRGLAMRRMERCIRRADRVCLLGSSRLAVCFGHGSHRIEPSELGARLARAMGDHLTMGTTTLDLRVTVGVSAGTVAVQPRDLAGAAIASTRSSRSRVTIGRSRHAATSGSSVMVINVPDPDELLHVSHSEDTPGISHHS